MSGGRGGRLMPKMKKINKYMKENTWKDLGIKEKLAIGTAVIAFIAGWSLVGISAFVALLISEQGVLWVLAQALLYSSGVFGVTAYFQSESKRLKRDISDMLKEHYNETEEDKM